MTAIAVVPTETAIIIAADGKKTLTDDSRVNANESVLRKESTTAQKIFTIHDEGRNLAYAMSGLVESGSFHILDNIKRKIKWMSRRNFKNCEKYVQFLSEKLNEELNQARASAVIEGDFPMLQRIETGVSWKLFDIVVVGYFNGQSSVVVSQFSHSKEHPIEFKVNSHSVKFLLSGSDVVRRAMYPDPGQVADPRFQQYVTDVSGKPSLDQARNLARGFVEACSSDLCKELDYNHWKITGGHIHIAKVTPQAFEWIEPPLEAA